MRRLEAWLKEHPELLPILVKRWNIKLDKRSTEDPAAVAKLMLEPARAEAVYGSLAEKQRDALRMLNGSANRLPAMLFNKLHGEVRKMGAGMIEREKPHEKPANAAEGLYYAGMIALGTEKLTSGLGPIVFIPDDLAQVLPFHKTSYSAEALEAIGEPDEIEDDEFEEEEVAAPTPPPTPAPRPVTPKKAAQPKASAEPALPSAEPAASVKERPAKSTPAPKQAAPPPPQAGPRLRRLSGIENPRPADTSLVDDMTTLLAFLQVGSGNLTDELALDDTARMVLRPHLIVKDDARLDFALLIGLSAGLIEVQGGRAYTRRAESRRWLEAPRAAQIQALADAWHESEDYIDLVHVRGLTVEQEGWSYDASEAREALLSLINDLVPQDAAWSVDEFIPAVYQTAPEFQRPGGDFDSWYIRNDDGEYLRGIDSWDAVEGALIEFVLFGPMYWLGLLTTGEAAVQLNAYGRAFLAGQPFPSRQEADERPVLEPDGTLKVSRAQSRFDRFQIARFTSWVSGATATEPYVYRVDAAGIQRGAQQGIQTEQIGSYLQRVLGNAPIPDFVATLLQQWRGGAQASVTLERLLILRTTAVETLDAIYKDPDLRRYLGARLGPLDVIVRADQWEALRDALGESGVSVDVRT